ncbi:CFI-box-CTERM domain-containing protein [Microcystis aeruginosa]|uniref:CFI-box-CTERM domain-containing protein n=1 Tax=Microcystis aeruginosa TaxID=1126 RepID=UPI0012311BCE|nr:CFI-box-CTERM domain-containing protein [Microcystis aeruginosa]GCA91115.1 hypothetical protein MiTa_04483 [Microcystis aeruginosa NIES-4264]
MSNFDQQGQIVYHQINQVINQQIINVNDEMVEKFVENFASLLPLDADDKIKKSITLYIITEYANNGNLPISSEQLTSLLEKLNQLSIDEFNRLLSSDKKYKQLRHNLGWYIFVGAGVGVGVGYASAKVDIEKIIQELTHNNSLYVPDLTPSSSSNPSSQTEDNSEQHYPRSSIPKEHIASSVILHKSIDSLPDTREPFLPVSSSRGSSSFPTHHQEQLLESSINHNISGGSPEPHPISLDKSNGDIEDCDHLNHCGHCDHCDHCFIATAVYGTYESPQVIKLRHFRDEKLRMYLLGKLFILIYYKLSPPLARWLKDSPNFAKPVRHILDMLVKCLES